MPHYLRLFISLSVLACALSACEELPEAVVKRNSALQGSMGWGGGFAPLPPLSQPAPPAQPMPANTNTAVSNLPPLPFPPFSPLPQLTPNPAETPAPPPASPLTPDPAEPTESPTASQPPSNATPTASPSGPP